MRARLDSDAEYIEQLESAKKGLINDLREAESQIESLENQWDEEENNEGNNEECESRAHSPKRQTNDPVEMPQHERSKSVDSIQSGAAPKRQLTKSIEQNSQNSDRMAEKLIELCTKLVEKDGKEDWRRRVPHLKVPKFNGS